MSKVSDFIESIKLTDERIKDINHKLVKAFIVCEISWKIIENSFFIELLKTLRESIWNFVIHTSNHHEYLWSLRNLTSERHTKKLLAEEIEYIIDYFGSEKFIAIVTDAGANIQ
ncbi:5013_t:CDS:2, partial [Diversispora eburnea]